MINKELHENFLNDFKELLKKYDAEFNMDFETQGWSHKDVPTIHFKWNEERGLVQELKLPNYID